MRFACLPIAWRASSRASSVSIMGLWCVLVTPLASAELPLQVGSHYAAQDSLACGDEASDDARQCLAGLTWKPAKFEVRCDEPQRGFGDFLVRFPSPVDTGNAVNDLVAMEWYPARDSDNNLLRAPAVVVVHESGRNMPVGRMIARGLQAAKLHTFLIQLPGYGVRKSAAAMQAANTFVTLRQAIADVRGRGTLWRRCPTWTHARSDCKAPVLAGLSPRRWPVWIVATTAYSYSWQEATCSR